MLQNEGTIDRILRMLAGVAIISLAVWGPRTPWAYLGLIPLLTGIFGFCPVYKVFGISTCPRRSGT